MKNLLFILALSMFLANVQKVNSQVDFKSSNLPIIIINTNNVTITDEPKVNAQMGIIYKENSINFITDSFNVYNGKIAIELRGNSSQNYSKKPYNFETRDATGNNLDVSLLGMPADNDWILLASYLDRTFIRDPLAHYISESLGEWTSHSRHCEVVLNGKYMGIYILIEKIKRTKNRLNLSQLNPQDITGESITGGYIYEVTGFTTYKTIPGDIGFNRVMHYPKPNEIASQQISYIKKYDNDFRSVMETSLYSDIIYGYERFINIYSFIDELITQEAMRNSDAYGWSGYFHKNKSEKISAGPVWDFDQSSGNSTYKDGANTTEWVFNLSDAYIPAFWKKLFDEPRFKYRLKLKWEEMRINKLSTVSINHFIDSCANMLDEAQKRNFTQWPTLGVFLWRETYGYYNRNTYTKEVDYLKGYTQERMAWIDNELSKVAVVPLSSPLVSNRKNILNLYPNPASDYIIINTGMDEMKTASLKIYNNLGIMVQNMMISSDGDGIFKIQINSSLSSGLYHILVDGNSKQTFTGSFVIER